MDVWTAQTEASKHMESKDPAVESLIGFSSA